MATQNRSKRNAEFLMFRCPGCALDEMSTGVHAVPVEGDRKWGWNQSVAMPTLTPSVLVQCPWGEARELRVCHSFVKDGQIQYLGDCTHALAGQTVDLPPWEKAPVVDGEQE